MNELKLLQRNVLKIGPADNVAVALTRLEAGDEVVLDGQSYEIRSRVPAKHKFALQDFNPGDRIVMYGVLVGQATTAIRKGEVITVSNMRHQSADFHAKSVSQDWDCARYFAVEDPDISGIPPRRWPGRHAQLLAGDSAGVLREQQYTRASGSV